MADDYRFILTLPGFVVVMADGSIMSFISEGEGTRAAALFTERLFAERARDHLEPRGEIQTIPSWDMLLNLHVPAVRHAGFTHVVVDPQHETGQGIFIHIDALKDARP